MEFKSFTDQVEVNGETVLSVIAAMEGECDRALKILASHGIPDPRPGEWYRQQLWLDAFKEIAETLGGESLYKIGRKIPYKAKFPPSVNTVEKALSSLNAAYHVNHRGGGIGSYRFVRTGESKGTMVCQNPYPCDFDRGLIEAVIDRYSSGESASTIVKHDAHASCRRTGSDSCTYLVEW